MRNPKRINRILTKLKKVWTMYPDLRLGQLIINCVVENGMDAYYLEDKLLEAQLDHWIKIGNKKLKDL